MYTFKVNNMKDVDLSRVIRENREEGKDICFLTFPNKEVVRGKEVGILLISDEFLDKFNLSDGINVAGMNLCENWGANCISVEETNNGFKLQQGRSSSSDFLMKIEGGQARIINLDSISELKKEIEKARKFKREIQVNVHHF